MTRTKAFREFVICPKCKKVWPPAVKVVPEHACAVKRKGKKA